MQRLRKRISITEIPAESGVDEATALKPYAIACYFTWNQMFCRDTCGSSRNAASAAAQLNDRGHIYIENAVMADIPRDSEL